MKKLKPSIKKKIAKIDVQLEAQLRAYFLYLEKLAEKYNIDFDNPNYMDSENYYEYLEYHAEAMFKKDTTISKLNGERAALLLIGYNIARRGKPLHEAKVLKEAAKLDKRKDLRIALDDGFFIRNQLYTPTPTSASYLHIALKKRGIKLLDTNAFRMIMANLDNLNARQHAHRNLIDKYEKHLHMFHKSIEKKLSNQKTK